MKKSVAISAVVFATLSQQSLSQSYGDFASYSLGTASVVDSADTSTGGFEIETGTANKKASLKLGIDGARHTSFITFSAPFTDKDAEETSFSEFDVFRDATSVELNLQWQSFKKPNETTGQSTESLFRATCRGGKSDCWALANLGDYEAAIDAEIGELKSELSELNVSLSASLQSANLASPLTNPSCDQIDSNKILITSGKFLAPPDTLAILSGMAATCERISALEGEREKLNGPGLLNRKQAFFDQIFRHPIWVAGITGEYGTKDFEFFEDSSADTQKQSENPWELGAYYSYGEIGEWAATVRYAYAEGYNASKSEIRCNEQPPENSDFLQCTSSPKAAPDRSEKDLLTVNFRKPLKVLSSIRGIPRVAIAPQAVYDLDKDEVLLSLPIYFSQKKCDPFTGGIKVEWDDENGTEFSVFIGKKLDLLEDFLPKGGNACS